MADMTRIVTAVIAITVRDTGREAQIDERYCAGFRSCAYNRGIHGRHWRTERVCGHPVCGHADGYRWHPYGRSQTHYQQVMSA